MHKLNFMKVTLFILFISSTLFAFSQEEKIYKNDISLVYGFELNHFLHKMPGVEYRRLIHKDWKLKISVTGDRGYSTIRERGNTTFDLSDTTVMYRRQYYRYYKSKTFRFGADFIRFKQFTIGAHASYGKINGRSAIDDRAFYKVSNGNPSDFDYVYSEELTANYHPPKPNPPAGTIPYCSHRSANLGAVGFRSFGAGLTGAAKWPIGKHFEVALQYNAELTHNVFYNNFNVYEKDEFIHTDYPNFWEFSQYANLFLRFKI